jgi:outer membrane protein assembly factor BamD (BamD/ComL family)
LRSAQKYADAVKAFDDARTKASLTGKQGLKARSLYMKGEAYLAQKDYPNALKTFDYTTGIFGGNLLTDEVKKWLGYATYEAGQCHYVQITSAKAGSRERAELIKNAKQYFQDVVKNYPDHAVADQAKKQLALLAKTK